MVLGALLDIGLPLPELRRALGSLALNVESVTTERVLRSGVSATKFRFQESAEAHSHAHHHHDHDHVTRTITFMITTTFTITNTIGIMPTLRRAQGRPELRRGTSAERRVTITTA